jgi:hypothetical protein
MKKLLAVTMSLLLCISFMTIISCKKAEEPTEAPKPAEAPMTPAPVQAPEAKGTDEHLQKAHEFFIKKDMKAAASEIQKAAELMKQEAEKATEEGKKGLMASANELEKLAKDVETGTVISEKKMKDVFAKAEHALANYHYLMASEQWTKKEAKETGNALKNAALHLEHAAEWAGQTLETGAADVIEGVRIIAGKLKEEAKLGAEEVDKAIKDLGAEISKLGKKIETKKKG